jgi:hypothetical protein
MDTEKTKISMHIHDCLSGGIVTSGETAIKIAEAVISGYYGDDKLKKSQPLVAVDKDEYWLIQGQAVERAGFQEAGLTPGGINIEIMKFDGRIRDFFEPLRLPPLPEEEK